MDAMPGGPKSFLRGGLSLRRLASERAVRVLGVRSLGLAALFCMEITLARWLGVAGYGTFSFVLVIATLVGRIAPLGWLNGSTKLISLHGSLNQPGLLKGVLIQSHVTTAIGLVGAMLVLASLRWAAPPSAAGINAWYVMFMVTAVALLELHRYILRGFHAGDLGEALPVLFLPAMVAAGIWVLQIGSADAAIPLYGTSCIVLLAASALFIFRYVPHSVWKVPAEFRMRNWALMAAAMMVGGLSDEVAARVPIMVLGSHGDDHGIGLFQAATRLALMLAFTLRFLTPVVAPRMSVLFGEGRLVELRATFLKTCLLSIMGSLPFFLLYMVAGPYVLRLFGSEFADASVLLRILSVGYLAFAMTGPCANGLMMIGKEKVYGSMALINLLLNAAVTYILTSQYGIIGAAVGTSAMMALTNLSYFVVFMVVTKPKQGAA